MGREIVAVAVVLAILTGSLVGLRRFQRPRESGTGPLRGLAKLRLSEHLVVHLIECAGERCLVTEQKSGSTVISLRCESGPPVHRSPEAVLPKAVRPEAVRPEAVRPEAVRPEDLDPKCQTGRAAVC